MAHSILNHDKHTISAAQTTNTISPPNTGPIRVAIILDFQYEDLEVQYPKLRLQEEGYDVQTISVHAVGTKCTGKYGYPCNVDLNIVSDWDLIIGSGIISPKHRASTETFQSDVNGGGLVNFDMHQLKTMVPKWDCVILPGGFAPDYYRRSASLKIFVSWMHFHNRVIAGICHGPWMLCSAKKLDSLLHEMDDEVAEQAQSQAAHHGPVAHPHQQAHHIPPIASGLKMTCFNAIKDDIENAGAIYIEGESVVVDKGVVTSRTPDDLIDFCMTIISEVGMRRNSNIVTGSKEATAAAKSKEILKDEGGGLGLHHHGTVSTQVTSNTKDSSKEIQKPAAETHERKTSMAHKEHKGI